MGQTLSPQRAPVLGDQARQAHTLAQQVRLGPTYSKIFFLIGGFLDAGVVDPSWSELAERAKQPRNTVRNAIKCAERRGVLVVERPGRPVRDRYELRTPKRKARRR